MDCNKIYPRTGDKQTVYLKSVINTPNIEVGDFTIYNDFVNDPRDFEKNSVLYHYPINQDRLIIGKFCSIACGVKFIFNCANHTLKSLSTYTFPLFFEEWDLPKSEVVTAWDNKGDIIIGNDVWIGYDAVIMAGVRIGDGAIIGARAVVTKDVEPYSIVGGIPAREIRKRFSSDIIRRLQKLQWWNWPVERIRESLHDIQSGNIDAFLNDASDIVIREIKSDEVPLLSDFLYEAIFQPAGKPKAPRTVIQEPMIWAYVDKFGSKPGDFCRVAVSNDGMIVGAAWSRLGCSYGKVDAAIPELAISIYPEYRGRGIGTRLLVSLMGELQDKGYDRVSLSVDKANYAVRMYRKVGFETIAEREHDYLMVKQL